MRAQRRAHIYRSLRSRNADRHLTSAFVWKFARKMFDPKPARGILCGHLQENCRSPIPIEPFCVEIYKENAGPQVRRARFVCACAVESHIWTFLKSQGKMPDPYPGNG